MVFYIQGGLPSHTVFPKLDELTLRLTDQWPLGSLRLLSSLINLSHLAKLSFEIDHSFDYYSETISNIGLLMKLTHNVHSLRLMTTSYYRCGTDYYVKICSVVPDHVRHLTVLVSTVDEMQIVVQRLKHRSSIKFQHRNYHYASDMYVAWFKHENGYYSYRLNSSSLCMWFDKCVNTSQENQLITNM